MATSTLVQPQHTRRKAVIYVRQSSTQQVLNHTESRRIQRDMKQHALRMGWSEHCIEVVEVDIGLSGKSIDQRHGYAQLLSDVALGEVGMILSYESTRLSRNCTDWYPLLDLCAGQDCLIADRDGVYDPGSINGRLLLGMKGIISELELHSLQGRLAAGIQNKAKRGELAIPIPAGLIRQEGVVCKNPDAQVQHTIDMVFQTFLRVNSASGVVQHLQQHGLLLPRHHRKQEVVWRPPTVPAILSILRNPAYAGAYAYGKTDYVPSTSGSPYPKRRRRPRQEWTILMKDKFPAYISWETYERIQEQLEQNHAEYLRRRTRGTPRSGSALLQGLVSCGICGHKLNIRYRPEASYLCNYFQRTTRTATCQYVSAPRVDAAVIAAFFEALSPAELDVYEAALQQREETHKATERAHTLQLQKLQYDAQLAQRRYENVDPANRLVASTLEQRWEEALSAVAAAEARQAARVATAGLPSPERLPAALRTAFTSLGKSLPALWATDALSHEQRKKLLRCLIDRVVVHRREEQPEVVHTRIVWRGGAVSEIAVPVPVGSTTSLSTYPALEKELLALESAGHSDAEIARRLTKQGFHSAKLLPLTAAMVLNIRLKNGRIHRYGGSRTRTVEGYWTVPQLASLLKCTPQWLYHRISKGTISVTRDPTTRLYLFPERPETLEALRRLQAGDVSHVSS